MSPMNNRRMTPTQEPGILDFAPGAAAAYSLRNLSLSYSGPVVTVRRSTDSAEADFTASEVSDGTLAAWCGGGDGFVKQWWDQSGNARHATQATAASQPQIVDSGVLVTEGGSAALRFDGNRNMQGSINVSQPITEIAVASLAASVLNDNNDYRLTWSSPAAVSMYKDDAATPDSFNIFSGTVLSGGNAIANQSIWFAVFSGANSGFHVNAVSQASGDAGTNGIGTLAIGAENTGIKGWNGTISELIIYPTDQTALRTRIEGNINRRFGVF